MDGDEMSGDFAEIEPSKLEHRLEGMSELIDALRQLAKSLPVSAEADDSDIVLTGFVDQASIDTEGQYRFYMAIRDIVTFEKKPFTSIVGRRVKVTIEFADGDWWKYNSTEGY